LIGVAIAGWHHYFSRPELHGPGPLWIQGSTSLSIQILLTVTVVGGNVAPLQYLGVAWSLALEEQIYAIYAFALPLIRRVRPLRLLALSFGISLAWGLLTNCITVSVPPYQFIHQNLSTDLSRVFFRQVPARGFEWILGLVAAEFYVGRVAIPRILRRPELALALLALGAIVFRDPVISLTLNGHRFFVSDLLLDQLFGLSFFVALCWAVDRERRSNGWPRPIQWLATIGLASYSLYLLHPALLQLLEPHRPSRGWGLLAGDVVMWIVIVAASYGFYLVCERPFVKRAQKVGTVLS